PKPHRVKAIVKGSNWETEKADTTLAIRELDPMAPDYFERHASLMAQLQDYASRTATADRIDWTEVRNEDGTPQTVGQMFEGLDLDGKRAYIAECSVTATREGVSVRTPWADETGETSRGTRTETDWETVRAHAKAKASEGV